MAGSANVHRVIAAVKRKTGSAVVRVTTAIHARLQEANPVDTGFSAANWPVSIGAPDRRVLGSPEGVDRAAAAASLAEAAQAYRVEMGSAFISNNTEYIGYLNEGSSDQAAALWIERAIADGLRDAARAP